MEDEIVISVYSRQDAIEDGVLIDVSEMAREAGFRIPVALTASVRGQYVEVPEGVECQDEAGRLWDILWMCHVEASRSGGEAEIRFRLHVRNDNRGGVPPLIELKAVCGPDDDGGPCVTVMLPEED